MSGLGFLAEVSFKNKELSVLYEKLNEAKKKLETSKLALKTSKTNFEDHPPKDYEKRTFFTRKNLDFLDEREDYRVDKPTLAKSNFLPDEFSGKKSQHVPKP